MKKFILFLAIATTLVSCDLDDDRPNFIMVPAEVTAVDLPEYFEEGETYAIEVTYELPDACHMPAGINVSRGSDVGNGRRDIFITGVASYEFGVECEEEDGDLEKTTSFQLKIDEEEAYTFYLWTSHDEQGENVYTEVVVPVGAPE